jgi:hypothetical protein
MFVVGFFCFSYFCYRKKCWSVLQSYYCKEDITTNIEHKIMKERHKYCNKT